MSSPHAAGVAALILGEKYYKPVDLVDKLLEYASDDKVQDPKDSDNELLYMSCDNNNDKCKKKKIRRKKD